MNDWIQRCTRGRQEAVKENNFLKKAFYKLVVNSKFISKKLTKSILNFIKVYLERL